MKTKMNYNSERNQSIKEQLVNREILLNVTELITHLISSEDKGDYGDELFKLGSTPDYETAVEDEGWIFNEGVYRNNDHEGEEYAEAEEIVEKYDYDFDYFKPYEFWAVTDWFAKKLKENGETVEEVMGLNVWGRQESGQMILLDFCISKIAEEMEILEGQKYEWK